jgi:calcineurin-like phosphoesterase family protein
VDYFTSDHHFGHTNMIGFADRPYTSEREMNNDMIDKWNETIGHFDVVYHLGDLTLGEESDAAYYFRKLNGRIKILACHRHHDRRWLPASFGPSCFISKTGFPVEILPPMVVLDYSQYSAEGDEGQYSRGVVLSHYPLAVWDRKHYGAYHLHGHSHGNYRPANPLELSMDVGVDCHGFRPVSILEVHNMMQDRIRQQEEAEAAAANPGPTPPAQQRYFPIQRLAAEHG